MLSPPYQSIITVMPASFPASRLFLSCKSPNVLIRTPAVSAYHRVPGFVATGLRAQKSPTERTFFR
jgi:hypothetical protein